MIRSYISNRFFFLDFDFIKQKGRKDSTSKTKQNKTHIVVYLCTCVLCCARSVLGRLCEVWHDGGNGARGGGNCGARLWLGELAGRALERLGGVHHRLLVLLVRRAGRRVVLEIADGDGERGRAEVVDRRLRRLARTLALLDTGRQRAVQALV